MNPATDGRPDRRPDAREESPQIGGLEEDFNFEQEPRPPMLLSPHPAPGPASEPPATEGGSPMKLGGFAAAVSPSQELLPDRLQLVASTARSQDLRTQGGAVQLLLGCNRRCKASVSGSVSVGGARLSLAPSTDVLPPGHAAPIELAPAPAERRALASLLSHGTATARLHVLARAPGQPLRTYDVSLRLSDG